MAHHQPIPHHHQPIPTGPSPVASQIPPSGFGPSPMGRYSPPPMSVRSVDPMTECHIHELLDHAERVNAVAQKYRSEADLHRQELARVSMALEAERRAAANAAQFEMDCNALAQMKVEPFREASEHALNSLWVEKQNTRAMLGGPW
eukprot:NODE_1310_length_913_cov_161.894402_g1264_i0.p1 GENE.NODE_1310_length_913_cov_161.894402_g1264_i0~~NODE_1310_length_913_cov_161.894402_g1264_i0.p1  ORF type:complete len:146 (-),score=27.98 NODE_1310_length_913_cov_161.894402_g1264_i0:362-799(-)